VRNNVGISMMINPEELDFRVYYNKMQLLLLNAGCMDLPTQKAIAYALECMETYGRTVLRLEFDANGRLMPRNECAILSEKSLAKDWNKEDEDWREL
jgi:hypothetical protein